MKLTAKHFLKCRMRHSRLVLLVSASAFDEVGGAMISSFLAFLLPRIRNHN